MASRPPAEVLGVFFHWVGPVIPGRSAEHASADELWVDSLDETEALHLLDWTAQPQPHVVLFPYEPPCCGIMTYWSNPDFELIREEATLRAGMVGRRIGSHALRSRLEALLHVTHAKAAAARGLRHIGSPLSIVPLLRTFVAEPGEAEASALSVCVKGGDDRVLHEVVETLAPLLAAAQTRRFVSRVLKRVAIPAALAVLGPFRSDEDAQVRKAVAILASTVNSPEARAILDMMLADPVNGAVVSKWLERERRRTST